ncbi:MAG TPA: ABC transporter ATP-binding protein [Anaerolineae bacterium]|nr:ABC transporter ATP-binding protein [Anaerolineae bacterium]
MPEAIALNLTPTIERALLCAAVAVATLVAFTHWALTRWRRGDARAFREPIVAFFALCFVEGALFVAVSIPGLIPATLIRGLDFAAIVLLAWGFLVSSRSPRIGGVFLGVGMTLAAAFSVFSISVARVTGGEPVWIGVMGSIISLTVSSVTALGLVLRRSPIHTVCPIIAFAALALSAALDMYLHATLASIIRLIAFWLLPLGLHRPKRGLAAEEAQMGGGLRFRTLRTILPFVRPYWRGFVPAVFAVVATSFVGLLKPWPLKFLIDNVLQVGQPGARPGDSATIIAAVAGSIVAIAVLQGLLSYSKEFFLSATAQRVAFGLRSALFAHIQRLPLAFHDRQRTGDLITRVTNDVTKVQELVTDDLLVGGATNLLLVVGILIVMLLIDRKLGLIATLSAPLIVLTTSYYRRRIRAQEQQVRDKEGDIASLAQETISSIRVVKAFGREGFETQRFNEQTGEMLEAGLRVARLEARFSWALNVVTAVSLAALVSFGTYQVMVGALSAGTLVVFIQYIRDLQSPLLSLSRLSTKVAKAAIRAGRVVEVLNERPAVEERPGARPAPRFRGQIRFDHVSFGYGIGMPPYSPERLVLRDIDLTIEPGEVVAIVGPTGAGKSTLASLILRLYDPLQGAVLIDGHDIREYKLDSVVDQMSVVLQESLLFQTTIRENIAYGQPKAAFRKIWEAACIAYCEEFIRRLPQGFDTVVGERGTMLSGGQRQRIAIARAVIRDAPILILDEPTAGLDAEAENIVMQALERLMRGRTTIMIAHQLATVRRANRIYVLDGGEIVEVGTHEELVAQGGTYKRAFQLQTA